MLEKLIQILKESGVYAWEINDETEEGWEFYFIRRALDQNRAKSVREIKLKVYQRLGEGDTMGSAAAVLAPTATEAELRKSVESLAYQATLAPNRTYELRKPEPAHAAFRAGETADASAIAGDFLKTMDAIPETETEDLNSYEIFASSVTRRFCSSQGIDVTERYPRSMIEAVVNARRDGHEIELYRLYNSGSCDAAGLTRDLTRAMAYGRDRLLAIPTPALGRADLLLSTDDAKQVYEYFVTRMDTSMVFRRMSDWPLGKPIDGDILGDKVTVTAVRELPNSSENRAFDAEGAPIRDTVLLRESVPEHYLGGRMFSSYMGIEDSFLPGNITVSGGTKAAEELQGGKCLEVVEFSDFQVDPMTGDMFGEIRLAYWRDGEKTVPVSGGSVSGNMRDFVREMYLSRESAQYDNMLIPAVTRLAGATVSGVVA